MLGVREPRLSLVPFGYSELGDLAVEFVRWCGMTLYPWQEDKLRLMLITAQPVEIGEDSLGRPQVLGDFVWSAREDVTVVARQNGKGQILIARELVGIFLLGEKTILHTAHLMDTAQDAQKRLWSFIEGNEDLLYWWDGEFSGVPKMTTANGKEAIHFPNGAMVYFRTRTKKTGRGISVDLLILDECFEMPREVYSAISKLTRARERAMTLWISSPVNTDEHMHGEVFSAKRWAAIDGAEQMSFSEWSPDDGDDPFCQETWAKCNPSMVDDGPGAQLDDIRADAVAAKNSSALLDTFLVETLGQGRWVPRDMDLANDFVPIIDVEAWESYAVMAPGPYSSVALAVDVTPSGESCSVVAALQCGRDFYLALNPVTEFSRDDVVSTIGKNVGQHDPVAVAGDPSGVVSTLVNPLEKTGVELEQLNGGQVSKAYELFLTLFREGRIRHDGDPRWVEALEIAEERSKNGRYRSLERFVGDVTCLVAASIALWALQEFSIPEAAPEVKQRKRFVGRVKPVAGSRAGALVKF